MFVARSKKALYFINLNSKSDHNKMIKIGDLNSDEWAGKADCLQAEVDYSEDQELRVLTVSSRLAGLKPGHKLMEIAYHLAQSDLKLRWQSTRK